MVKLLSGKYLFLTYIGNTKIFFEFLSQNSERKSRLKGAARDCSAKHVFLKTSQNSQDKTFVGVFFQESCRPHPRNLVKN